MLPEARPILPARRVFKVVSYNILAPKYSGYNSYCPPELLAWEYRRPLVLRELSRHDADLLGLQECDEEFFGRELSGWMAERGMEGEFLPRNVGPIPGPTEGIALLWRSSLLQAVARRSIVFAEMDPRVAGLPQEVADTEPWRKLRELGEGAVLVLLRHRPTGQLLLGAVTHLFWNPAFPDVKALQAALLCGAMASFALEAAATAASGGAAACPPSTADAFASTAPDATAAAAAASATAAAGAVGTSSAMPVPAVLCGDFNSLAVKRLPDSFDPQVPPEGQVSGVYQLLSTGSLPPSHPDHPHTRVWAPPPGAPGARTHPTAQEASGGGGGGAGGQAQQQGRGRFPALPLGCSGLCLTSLNAEAFGREPPLTTRTATFAGCLDYVWLSRSPQLAAASALGMPYTGDESEGDSWQNPLTDIAFRAIPDAVYPSDHLAVGGQVVLLAPP